MQLLLLLLLLAPSRIRLFVQGSHRCLFERMLPLFVATRVAAFAAFS